MSTCVVTGGAGFVGSHLCESLLGQGHRVLCFDNLDTGNLENIEHIGSGDFVFIAKDVTEEVTIDEPVDFVYHLASPASPIDYARLPLHTLKVGSQGTHHMLGVAKYKRARFLLTSTSEVYGDPEIHPQPESYWGNVNPIGPRGVYDEAKRYAEALTMAYHRQQGVNTCIARLFNSVLASEQILYDDGRELRRETASALAARMMSHTRIAAYAGPGAMAGEQPAPAFEWPLEGFSVASYGGEGEMVAAEPMSFIGHPTEQRCYRVSTRYGRSISVTADHSIFVRGADGEPEPKPVGALEPGDKIAIASRIEVPERDRTVASTIEAWRYGEEDIWDLSVTSPELGQKVWENRFDVHGMVVARRGEGSKNVGQSAWGRVIRMRDTGRVPLPVLWRIGAEVSPGDLVRTRGNSTPFPAEVQITDDLLWLLGLYVAEGCTHERPGKSAVVSISCERATLERAEAVIRRRLGLHVVRSSDGAVSPSIAVNSVALLRVLDLLGFDHNRKRIPGWILGLPLSRLKWFLEGYREGDGVHSGKKLDEGKMHEFSTVHDELKDDLIVAFARFGLLPSVGRYETTFKQATGERRYPFWRLTLSNVSPWSPLEWDRGVAQKLNAQRHGDIVWASVNEITEVPATELVFDFSVPGYENFVAGTGVLAHNTYGSRMRPHDGRAIPTFLRQALQDKPVTVFGDGSQTRSFCFIDDLIRGLVALAESDAHLPVNLGNPDEYTLLQLAESVIEVSESKSEIVFEALPVDDPKVRQPDISRAKDILGWEPTTDLLTGLRKTIEQSGAEKLIGSPR